MCSIFFIDEVRDHTGTICEGLERAGYDVATSITAPHHLASTVERTNPDVIVVNTNSPSRDVLEHLGIVTRDHPRPIVMFARDDGPETIRDATAAGVTSYVVGGVDVVRVKSIVEVARARFAQVQHLRANLALAQSRLAERERVERVVPARRRDRMIIIRA